jgi:hypothetical protein
MKLLFVVLSLCFLLQTGIVSTIYRYSPLSVSSVTVAGDFLGANGKSAHHSVCFDYTTQEFVIPEQNFIDITITLAFVPTIVVAYFVYGEGDDDRYMYAQRRS